MKIYARALPPDAVTPASVEIDYGATHRFGVLMPDLATAERIAAKARQMAWCMAYLPAEDRMFPKCVILLLRCARRAVARERP